MDFFNLSRSRSRSPSPPPSKKPRQQLPPSRRTSIRPYQTGDIPPPYPWATSKRAKLHSLQHLLSAGITAVTGRVKCKKCDVVFEMEYELERSFREVSLYIVRNREGMYDRAPKAWTDPTLPDCGQCGQARCVKPVMAAKKRNINWLFLFLGQMVGCCKLNELKYFCKYTRLHRTGAKDRVLYLTYMEIFDQLKPNP